VRVALVGQLRNGVEPLRRPGIPGNKHQIAVRRAFRIPLQIVFAVERLAVVVHPEERHIEVVTGMGKIIGIAAKNVSNRPCGQTSPNRRRSDARWRAGCDRAIAVWT